MFSHNQKRFIQLILIFVGIITGGLFIAPLLNFSKEGSFLLGGFLGFLISFAIFPDMLKSMFEEQGEKRAERIMEKHQLGFYRYLTHPTQIPIMLSMLLFVVVIALVALSDFLKTEYGVTILQGGMFGVAFLWGLSGLLMIKRNEYIDKTGRRYQGWWAIVQGVVFLLMGWGSIIFLLLAAIFNW